MEAVGCLAAIYLMQEICCDVSGGLVTHELHYVACDPPIKKLVKKSAILTTATLFHRFRLTGSAKERSN